MSMPITITKKALAEALSTAGLLAAVVGSGIMGERLSGGSVGLALLANTVATGAALVVLIMTFGPISGAHMNPAVTLIDAAAGKLPWREVPAYIFAQVAGAVGGVTVADAMFQEPLIALSTKVRSGPAQLLSEAVAIFGLVVVIAGVAKARPAAVPFAVGLYITSAYWFTASTSFANPAVTIARSLTNTFAGIRPADVPGFLVAQTVGAVVAVVVVRFFFSSARS